MTSQFIPASFTAGDSLAWTVKGADHPASDGWALTYYLVKAGQQIEIAATAAGADHQLTVTATTTAAWPAGRYHYQAVASKGDERATIDSGRVEIHPNFAAQSAGYDARHHDEIVLDALYAVQASKATEDQASISIGDRALTHMSPGQINEWIRIYEAKVARLDARQRRRRGQATRRRTYVRFS